MTNRNLLQSKHTRWPPSESHCSPHALRSEADPSDANALLVTRADSADGKATANSISIQNYRAGQLELELPEMAHRDNSCHRWHQWITPKTIAARAYSISARGRFGLYSRPTLGHAIAGKALPTSAAHNYSVKVAA